MIIDLNPMLRGEISSLDVEFSLAPELIDGVTFEGDARVFGIRNLHVSVIHARYGLFYAVLGVVALVVGRQPVKELFVRPEQFTGRFGQALIHVKTVFCFHNLTFMVFGSILITKR